VRRRTARLELFKAYFFIFSIPRTTPAFCEGCEAFCLGAFSALGLRTSRFDFFWDLAMTESFAGGRPAATLA
jgi:hypothetical protein